MNNDTLREETKKEITEKNWLAVQEVIRKLDSRVTWVEEEMAGLRNTIQTRDAEIMRLTGMMAAMKMWNGATRK